MEETQEISRVYNQRMRCNSRVAGGLIDVRPSTVPNLEIYVDFLPLERKHVIHKPRRAFGRQPISGSALHIGMTRRLQVPECRQFGGGV